MRYQADVVFLGLFVAVSGAILWLARTFPETGERFGPAFLPEFLALLLIVLSAVLLGQWLAIARRGGLARARVPAGFFPKAGLQVVMLAAYTVWLSRETPLGFPFLTMLFLFGTGLLFGGRSPIRVGLMAVVTAVGLYAFFRLWLHVPLRPSGWF